MERSVNAFDIFKRKCFCYMNASRRRIYSKGKRGSRYVKRVVIFVFSVVILYSEKVKNKIKIWSFACLMRIVRAAYTVRL